jgi:hypothetical protein
MQHGVSVLICRVYHCKVRYLFCGFFITCNVSLLSVSLCPVFIITFNESQI